MTSCNAAPADSVSADDTGNINSVNADNSVNPVDSVTPEDEVGLVYADPIIDMLILIDGQDWAYTNLQTNLRFIFT